MIPKVCRYAGIASPHDVDMGLFPGRSQNFFMCFLRKINHSHRILLTSASDEKQVFMAEDAQASHRGFLSVTHLHYPSYKQVLVCNLFFHL